MRLLITDPVAIAVNAGDVVSVRAEDPSGGFGILASHADFLTTLSISVVSWRHGDGRQGFCAVRNGILTVANGSNVSIATREAHISDDLDELQTVVLAGYRAHVEGKRVERTASAKLRMQAIRYMVDALDGRPGTSGL